jgi:phosphohistidine phosphatase
MRLYLVQHGDAVPEQVDPQRPLSAAGRRDVEAIGRLLASAGVRSTRVVHSGKLRAQQTAELLAKACSPDHGVEAAAGLSPNDPVKPVARMVASLSADTMLVGHLPFMGRLAGRLVTGDEHVDVVAFVPGTVLCLEPAADDRWRVVWMVRPGLATRDA